MDNSLNREQIDKMNEDLKKAMEDLDAFLQEIDGETYHAMQRARFDDVNSAIEYFQTDILPNGLDKDADGDSWFERYLNMYEARIDKLEDKILALEENEPQSESAYDRWLDKLDEMNEQLEGYYIAQNALEIITENMKTGGGDSNEVK